MDEIFKQLEQLKLEETSDIPEPKKCNCNVELYECRSTGTVVCTECGIVYENTLIDSSAEWIANGPDDSSADPSRCGGPINPFFERSSMSTMIQGGNKNSLMQRIHSQMSMDYIERSRWHVFEHINKLAIDKAGLSQLIVNQAKMYYIKLSDQKISRGNIRKGLIACCIFYACKANKASRSAKEIAELCGITVSLLNKAAKIFEPIIQIENVDKTDTTDLVSRYINELNLDRPESAKIISDVNFLFQKVDESGVVQGKTPNTVTAALIYITLKNKGYNVDKKKIISLYKISMVTLNKLLNLIQSSALIDD